jgi:hypothetical protein
MTPPPAPPAWAPKVKGWLQQTSTRSGIIFALPTALGYQLAPEHSTAIAAAAGLAAAIFGLIYPDKPPGSE